MRDIADQLPEEVTILGMSADPPKRQKRFDERNGLGFGLLSDADNSVTGAFGARGEKRIYGNTFMATTPSGFLIDAEGRIERAWYGVGPDETSREFLAALEESGGPTSR